jgi:hypothetical protein
MHILSRKLKHAYTVNTKQVTQNSKTKPLNIKLDRCEKILTVGQSKIEKSILSSHLI